MDVQYWFYTIGIIYMALWILLMLLGVIVLLQIMFFIKNAPKKVEEIISNVIEENKGSLMGMAAMGVVSLVASRIKSIFNR